MISPPSPAPIRLGASDWRALGVIISVAVLARLAAQLVLPVNTTGDPAAYLEMARTALGPGVMRDNFGNLGFFSPGYALLLGILLAPMGVSIGGVALVNLALAAVTTLLVYLVARAVGGSWMTAAFAALLQAGLIPAIAASTMIARENLSVALLAGFALAVVTLITTRRPAVVAAAAGLCYGAGLLAGASVILTACAVPLALVYRGGAVRRAALALTAFVAAAALIVGPWLWHMQDALGRPVLTTNAPFNLYVGNNPAATGHFVSLRDTPAGAAWHEIRARKGELAATDWLGALAGEHIRAHPVDTAALAAKKIALFWSPDIPDASDSDHGVARLIRWVAVAEHLAIMLLAVAAGMRWRQRSRGEQLLVAMIALFWAVHAAAYVMPRYRLPAMALVVVLAAAPLAELVTRRLPAGRGMRAQPA